MDIEEIFQSLSVLVADPNLSEGKRVELLDRIKKLAAVLERPEDVLTKLAFSPSQFMTARVATELKLFDVIVRQGKVNSEELAETTGANKVLIERLLRVLTASGMVDEAGVSTYTPNKITKTLTSRTGEAMIRAFWDIKLKSMARIPEYLHHTGYKNPEDATNGPFQFAYGLKDQPFFDWLHEPKRAREHDTMHTYFEGDRGSRPDWVKWFPVEEKFFKNVKTQKDDVVMVDVAGGRGHDLDAFVRRFLDVQGRYVLQDLPMVLDDRALELHSKIEKIAMDFWKDQPVSGARIYYMKFIMHDWNDERCLQILTNVTAAMTKGYSFLVVEDFIIPDQGCPLLAALFDMQMMNALSAMERTEGQWVKLLKAAGLRVEGCYPPPGDGTGIIVAELK
ncbi:O-methyltransferase [Lophiotrema nucula]|uniref:O-methyltransferase n=1 Tax=Lophiotrema nucula TaxID=690887 RepID=A0A6A5YQ17_9PLEO|nr:O-methyltransferase [Lophiotrema nucula]